MPAPKHTPKDCTGNLSTLEQVEENFKKLKRDNAAMLEALEIILQPYDDDEIESTWQLKQAHEIITQAKGAK